MASHWCSLVEGREGSQPNLHLLQIFMHGGTGCKLCERRGNPSFEEPNECPPFQPWGGLRHCLAELACSFQARDTPQTITMSFHDWALKASGWHLSARLNCHTFHSIVNSAVLLSAHRTCTGKRNMPEQVKQVGTFTVAIGHGKPKAGSKNALSPVYRWSSMRHLLVPPWTSTQHSVCLQHFDWLGMTGANAHSCILIFSKINKRLCSRQEYCCERRLAECRGWCNNPVRGVWAERTALRWQQMLGMEADCERQSGSIWVLDVQGDEGCVVMR